jgi:hypothetical protein
MQEWQNGAGNLLAQDHTTLPRLLQTQQEHKTAWLAQIRLALLGCTTTHDNDTETDTTDNVLHAAALDTG